MGFGSFLSALQFHYAGRGGGGRKNRHNYGGPRDPPLLTLIKAHKYPPLSQIALFRMRSFHPLPQKKLFSFSPINLLNNISINDTREEEEEEEGGSSLANANECCFLIRLFSP